MQVLLSSFFCFISFCALYLAKRDSSPRPLPLFPSQEKSLNYQSHFLSVEVLAGQSYRFYVNPDVNDLVDY